ncbi:hypothetical protein GQ42DRAFT_176958 [Ramicandelaber brevisporus]|nr:hypothetical protein GQ42DRAFT_176958 [Ramicandelaber brevisporus]
MAVQTSPLLWLPTELLLLIANELPTSEHFELLFVCRAFHDAFVQSIWREPTGKLYELEHREVRDSAIQRYHQFIRTVAYTPSMDDHQVDLRVLLKHVNHLVLPLSSALHVLSDFAGECLQHVTFKLGEGDATLDEAHRRDLVGWLNGDSGGYILSVTWHIPSERLAIVVRSLISAMTKSDICRVQVSNWFSFDSEVVKLLAPYLTELVDSDAISSDDCMTLRTCEQFGTRFGTSSIAYPWLTTLHLPMCCHDSFSYADNGDRQDNDFSGLAHVADAGRFPKLSKLHVVGLPFSGERDYRPSLSLLFSQQWTTVVDIHFRHGLRLCDIISYLPSVPKAKRVTIDAYFGLRSFMMETWNDEAITAEWDTTIETIDLHQLGTTLPRLEILKVTYNRRISVIAAAPASAPAPGDRHLLHRLRELEFYCKHAVDSDAYRMILTAPKLHDLNICITDFTSPPDGSLGNVVSLSVTWLGLEDGEIKVEQYTADDFVKMLSRYPALERLWVNKENYSPFFPPRKDGKYGAAGIFKGAQTVFFAYIGFDAVSTGAQECRNPQRDLPVGICLSLLICTALYIAVTAVLLGLRPYPQLDTKAPLVNALELHPGSRWLRIMVEVGGVAGLTSVMLIMLMGQPRIMYAMAKDGLMPRIFSRIHPRFKTPYIPTICTGVICAIAAAFLPIDLLGDLTSVGTLLAFFLVNLSVPVLRYSHPNAHRGFRVPLGPYIVPFLGAIIAMLLIVMSGTSTGIRLAAWIGIGWIVYAIFGYRSSHLNNSHHIAELTPTDEEAKFAAH